MTYDDFLDNEKSRGIVIYRCMIPHCKFRGIGASVTYHEANAGRIDNLDHRCINEDKLTLTTVSSESEK